MVGDYISREAATAELCERCADAVMCTRSDDDCPIKKGLNAIPAADVVEVRHGRWNRIDHDALNCNKCGSTFILLQGYEKMRHCPNCGAIMDGGRDDA